MCLCLFRDVCQRVIRDGFTVYGGLLSVWWSLDSFLSVGVRLTKFLIWFRSKGLPRRVLRGDSFQYLGNSNVVCWYVSKRLRFLRFNLCGHFVRCGAKEFRRRDASVGFFPVDEGVRFFFGNFVSWGEDPCWVVAKVREMRARGALLVTRHAFCGAHVEREVGLSVCVQREVKVETFSLFSSEAHRVVDFFFSYFV